MTPVMMEKRIIRTLVLGIASQILSRLFWMRETRHLARIDKILPLSFGDILKASDVMVNRFFVGSP
jgi:hypothetical protein